MGIDILIWMLTGLKGRYSGTLTPILGAFKHASSGST